VDEVGSARTRLGLGCELVPDLGLRGSLLGSVSKIPTVTNWRKVRLRIDVGFASNLIRARGAENEKSLARRTALHGPVVQAPSRHDLIGPGIDQIHGNHRYSSRLDQLLESIEVGRAQVHDELIASGKGHPGKIDAGAQPALLSGRRDRADLDQEILVFANL